MFQHALGEGQVVTGVLIAGISPQGLSVCLDGLLWALLGEVGIAQVVVGPGLVGRVPRLPGTAFELLLCGCGIALAVERITQVEGGAGIPGGERACALVGVGCTGVVALAVKGVTRVQRGLRLAILAPGQHAGSGRGQQEDGAALHGRGSFNALGTRRRSGQSMPMASSRQAAARGTWNRSSWPA